MNLGKEIKKIKNKNQIIEIDKFNYIRKYYNNNR